MKSGSNTTLKQRGGVTGKGFVKGDPRINRRGRPKSFDELRKLAQELANEEVEDKKLGKVIRARSILRQWSESKEPMLQVKFMEYAFGKVPDKLEGVRFPTQTLILHYDHERPNNGRATNGTNSD